ncbi:hypothetical protein IW261DRAFT_358517 [Armillaria novae-zelandiae]|uniref:Zn(2)-C6 fungal-type domain-containing protein n=1 Tax=Armillaria novae-zelandiae TaxID=153914 RepID=A0AA39PQE2_9AGAR|nr:hypothetical protein IW261DRAFT_358517 [Armillaria novae-zelandiae]
MDYGSAVDSCIVPSNMSELGESTRPTPSKQRRLQGACDICRSKKIRCDSAKMPGNKCSNCVAFGEECTHLAVMAKKVGSDTHALSNPIYSGSKDRLARPYHCHSLIKCAL